MKTKLDVTKRANRPSTLPTLNASAPPAAAQRYSRRLSEELQDGLHGALVELFDFAPEQLLDRIVREIGAYSSSARVAELIEFESRMRKLFRPAVRQALSANAERRLEELRSDLRAAS